LLSKLWPENFRMGEPSSGYAELFTYVNGYTGNWNI